MQEVLDETGQHGEPADGWVESDPLTTDDLTNYILNEAVTRYARDYPGVPHYEDFELDGAVLLDAGLIRERRFGILQGLAMALGCGQEELRQMVILRRRLLDAVNDRSADDLDDSRG